MKLGNTYEVGLKRLAPFVNESRSRRKPMNDDELLAILCEEICDRGRVVHPHIRNSWGECTGKGDQNVRQVHLSLEAQREAAEWLAKQDKSRSVDP